MALRSAAIPSPSSDAQGAHGAVGFALAGTWICLREHGIIRTAAEECWNRYDFMFFGIWTFADSRLAGSRGPSRQVSQQKDIPQQGNYIRPPISRYLLNEGD